jgi:hypothetical protein
MKYVDRYPTLTAKQMPPGRTDIFTSPKNGPCCVCKEPTRWVWVDDIKRVCSDECLAVVKGRV